MAKSDDIQNLGDHLVGAVITNVSQSEDGKTLFILLGKDAQNAVLTFTQEGKPAGHEWADDPVLKVNEKVMWTGRS